MKQYQCHVCSHRKNGDFIFLTLYENTSEDAAEGATRCPRCGKLASSPDVGDCRRTDRASRTERDARKVEELI